MLGQIKTYMREKSMKYDRKSIWDSSVMRKAMQVQTFQASAIMANKNIFGG